MGRLVRASFWRQPGMHPLRASLGAMLALGLAAMVTAVFIPDGAALPYLVAPMGASAVLVFALPAAPLAQPRAVLGGNVLSALCGVAVARLVDDPMLAGPLAAGLAILAMQLCRCLHPPGGAVALVAVLGGEGVREAGFSLAVMPVGLNCLLLLGAAIVFNNLAGSRYPHRQPGSEAPGPLTSDAAAPDRSGFTRADIEAAIDRLDDRPDIDVEDLADLLREVEAEAFARLAPEPLVRDIMSRDVATCHRDDWTEDALLAMDSRRVSALPVLDGKGRVAGLVDRGILAAEPGRRVREVMRGGPCLVAGDTPAAALVPVLSDGIHHQAVVIEADGALAGLVSQTDLLASLWRGSLRRGEAPAVAEPVLAG